MKKLLVVLLLFIVELFAENLQVNLGKFNEQSPIFKQKDISKLTSMFLDIKYSANTLSSYQGKNTKEELIINLEAFDCFTFLDTIEALKNSSNFKEFKQELIQTRYKDGKVTYKNRNHFFFDWIQNNDMKDITCELGTCKKETKYLNKNYKYLKEIPEKKVEISFINPKDIDLKRLKTGDYIGIYTSKDDLDVTHTGIIIKKENKVFIRHASGKYKKVMDSELFSYTKNKKNVIIYRNK